MGTVRESRGKERLPLVAATNQRLMKTDVGTSVCV
jgi:hypothetical protein